MTCDCYRTGGSYGDYCFGTRECDPCKCKGDKRLCDFYESVRAKGYEEATEKHKFGTWVKINSDLDLPDTEGKYIVCTSKGAVYSTKFHISKYDKYFGTDSSTHITHWMPMPEPPEEYKKRNKS